MVAHLDIFFRPLHETNLFFRKHVKIKRATKLSSRTSKHQIHVGLYLKYIILDDMCAERAKKKIE